MTERELLLKKLASYDFALVELHLYLDTHSSDKAALAKLNEYEQKANVLRREYESNFGPLSPMSEINNPYAWINSPWPWDGGEE